MIRHVGLLFFTLCSVTFAIALNGQEKKFSSFPSWISAADGTILLEGTGENARCEVRVLGTKIDRPKIVSLTNIRNLNSLTLSGCDFTLDAILALSELSTLKVLDLGGACLPADSMSKLAKLPQLESLNVSATGLVDQDARFFKRFRSLKTLIVGGNLFTGAGYEQIARCEGLRTLVVVDSAVDGQSLAGLQASKSLKTVVIDWVPSVKGAFEWLSRVPNLEELAITLGPITEGESLHLDPIFRCQNLHVLRLHSDNVRLALSKSAIEGLQRMSKLEKLSLNSQTPLKLKRLTQLTELVGNSSIDSLPKSLATIIGTSTHSPTVENLKRLSLPKLEQASVVLAPGCLPEIEQLQTLRELYLRLVNLRKEHARLDHLGNLKKLEVIQLSGLTETLEGRSLQFLTRLPSLRKLVLMGCQLDAEARAIIGQLSQLTQLQLLDCSIQIESGDQDANAPFSMLKELRNVKHLSITGRDAREWCLHAGNIKNKGKYQDPVKFLPRLVSLDGWSPFEPDEYSSQRTLKSLSPYYFERRDIRKMSRDYLMEHGIPFDQSSYPVNFPNAKISSKFNIPNLVQFPDRYIGKSLLTELNDALSKLVLVKTRSVEIEIDNTRFVGKQVIDCFLGAEHLQNARIIAIPELFHYAWDEIQIGKFNRIGYESSFKFQSIDLSRHPFKTRGCKKPGCYEIGLYVKQGSFFVDVGLFPPTSIGLREIYYKRPPGIPWSASTSLKLGESYQNAERFAQWFGNWYSMNHPINREKIEALLSEKDPIIIEYARNLLLYL